MGFMTGFKANKAYRLQKNGQTEEAIALYEEVFAEGLDDPRYNLAYALMIIRKGEYQKAKEFLVKHQKAPGMTPDQRTNLLVDYAVCCFRLGNIDKGIDTLEQQARKGETGLIYQTLGYLYVEKYDAANKPDFPEEEASEAMAGDPAEETGASEASGEAPAEGDEGSAETPAEEPGAEKTLSPREAWEAGVEKAAEFIDQSIEYDDEDAICLDNKGQFLYRVLGDKKGARKWFDKAIKIKDNQIDTLYFLSRYDEEAGDRQAALEKMEKAAAGRFSPLNYCSRETIEQEIARLKGAN